MIRLLSIFVLTGIVFTFGMLGFVTLLQRNHYSDWDFVWMVFLLAVPLAYLIALALTNRE